MAIEETRPMRARSEVLGEVSFSLPGGEVASSLRGD